jgi:hypothetical protein
MDIEGDQSTTVTNVKFDVYPLDNLSKAEFRFFRSTNTSGPKTLTLFRGDGTATESAQIGVDGLNSYFQLHGGGLGIGTNSPAGTLHAVNTSGSLRLNNLGATFVTRQIGTPLIVTNEDNNSTQNYGHIELIRGNGAGTDCFITTTGDGTNGVSAMGFWIGGMKMQILSGGNIGIGTLLPDQLLSVNGNASKPGGGSWVTFSDRRVKHSINPFTDGLNVIMQLDPVTFKYNEKSGYADTNKEFVGFIAQDVEKVAPYMVNLYDDSKGTSGLADKRQFDESALNKILVNAVQQQQAQIEQLKKELQEMKSLLLEKK